MLMKPNIQSLKKSNKTDKPLARLTKTRRMTQTTNKK